MTNVDTETITQATSTEVEQMLLQYRVEQFLFQEADLLDTLQFNEWLALWTEDMHYYMPTRKNRLRRQRDPDTADRGPHMAHFDDHRPAMELRVMQKESGRNWAEDPPSRTRHVISNVRIDESVGADNEFEVRSNFMVYRNRLETEMDIWAGERIDGFRRDGDSFKIAKRTILLDQNVILSKNLSTLF